MSTTPENTTSFQLALEGVLEELRSVTTSDDYNNARANLYFALDQANKAPELQDLAYQIEAVRTTNHKTFTGDITRSLLIGDLEIFLLEVKMKAED